MRNFQIYIIQLIYNNFCEIIFAYFVVFQIKYLEYLKKYIIIIYKYYIQNIYYSISNIILKKPLFYLEHC